MKINLVKLQTKLANNLESEVKKWYEGPLDEKPLLEILTNRSDPLNEILDALIDGSTPDRLCNDAAERSKPFGTNRKEQ